MSKGSPPFILLLIVISLIFADGPGTVSLAQTSPPVSFSREVRPILSDKCFKCHGPDQRTRKAGLRLDQLPGAVHVLENTGPKSTSLLLQRIESADPDFRMPPQHSKLTLSKSETDTLRHWIEQGALYETHWSLKPIKKTELPEITDSDWARNEIDYFTLHKLEQAGLTQSSEAKKETLIRRLMFDLTGLPPRVEEINTFLDDNTSEAYESLVNRILSKTAYGERMAVNWLDVARYSDTYGYQVDRNRYVWPWRDWVVSSFNNNLSYDQFITWQLAGDLLPNATREQIIATTFNRLHSQKVEGGSIPEEFRVEYVADRVHTFGTAFLGLTLECARCHDHKYDPITQQEYYQFFAYFNNIDEAGLYSYFTSSVPTPTLVLRTPKQEHSLNQLTIEIQQAYQSLQTLGDSRQDAFEQWKKDSHPLPDCLSPVQHLDFEQDNFENNKGVTGVLGQAVQLTGDDGIELKVGNFHRYEPFSISLWIKVPETMSRAVIFHRSRAWTDAGSRGYELLLDHGRLRASLIHFWPGNAISIRTLNRVPIGEWTHVVMTYDGSSKATGLNLYIHGRKYPCSIEQDNLYKEITGGGGDNITIGARFRDRGFTDGQVDEFQVFARELTTLDVRHLFTQTPYSELLNCEVHATDFHPAFSEPFDFFLSTVDTEFQSQLQTLRTLRKQWCTINDPIDEIMVMGERNSVRSTYRLRRGAYDDPQEQVFPGTPTVMSTSESGQTGNRLTLAQWLTNRQHPLTARVAVNRFWQICFGEGLVRTPEDFGNQGQAPVHPELLDWLAADFMEHAWDVKHLIKTIVSSATYRQRSSVTSNHLLQDPENHLFSRSPRYRLSAEMLRDNALAVSGLLVSSIGGPPTHPYELEVSFKPLEHKKGEELYRRSLYTFWKRTAPAPVMMALDASKRDVCSVKRERTSSPLQALILLNSPQFVEAARILAEDMLHKHGNNQDGLLAELFRTMTSRFPTVEEKQVLSELFGEQQAYFEEYPDRAELFLSTGDTIRDMALETDRLAAISIVTLTLMNFDECIIKR